MSYLNDLSILTSMPWYWLVIISTWVLAWKCVSMWKAARKGHAIWFVLLLVINTFGILEILYIFLFSDLKLEEKKSRKKKKR